MIVYREFSSLLHDLGFSGKTLYSVSNHISRHYHTAELPKSNGETRKLLIPDNLLKAIQRRINEKLLFLEDISPYATAYRPGSSNRRNAAVHIGKAVLLKLDIRHFFDHLIYPIVKEKAFPAKRYSEQNRVLLSLLCVYQDALPQGAPTSPTISNIIMKDFDNTVGNWCAERQITYTRYCDDMTFSGDFDPRPVITLVKDQLKAMGLFLNQSKTVLARKGQKHAVTGLVVNEKISIPAHYKKQLRQEMHYCMKYGVSSHLKAIGLNETEETYLIKLLGRINYVLSVEPAHSQMQEYKRWLRQRLQQLKEDDAKRLV